MVVLDYQIQQKDHVSKDILDYVNEQADKIKSGEIKVPENEKQYNEIVGK